MSPPQRFRHSSSAAIGSKSKTLRDAIAWSPNAEKYYSLLAEFAHLEKEISAVMSPTLRTKSALLARLLPNTIVYAAIPAKLGVWRLCDIQVERATLSLHRTHPTRLGRWL